MKRRKKTIRERIMGGVGGFFLTVVLIFINNALMGLSQVYFWMLLGPIIFFVLLFAYFLSGIITREDDKEKEIEYKTDFKSVIIGIFIWFVIMIATYLLNIEFSHFANEIGGLATIFIVILCIRKKSDIPIF